MIYTIRSHDGRTIICTSSASAAAKHAAELRMAGIAFTLNDLNGHGHDLAGLAGQAHESSPAPASAANAILPRQLDEARRR